MNATKDALVFATLEEGDQSSFGGKQPIALVDAITAAAGKRLNEGVVAVARRQWTAFIHGVIFKEMTLHRMTLRSPCLLCH